MQVSDNGTPATESAEGDLMADLRSAFDEVEGREAPEVTDAPVEAPEVEATDTPTDDRPRDEHGRFTAKENTPTDDAPVEGEAAPVEEPAAPVEDVEPPQHWPEADKDMLRKQPPEARKWLIERHKAMEADHTRKTQEIAPLRRVADQWTPYFRQLGTTPDQAFTYLVGAEYALRTGTPQQKADALQKIAQDYGIQLSGDGTQSVDQEYVDPTVQQLIVPLQQKIADLESQLTTRQLAEQEQQYATALQSIEAFMNQKTEAGELAHPYFEEVQDRVTRFARAEREAGRTPDLQTLYDEAVWANPATREKLLAAQRQAAAKKEADDRKARALAAQKASASVAGAPSGSSGTGGDGTIRGALDAAWNESTGRV